MALDPRLLAILACPEDRQALWYFPHDGFLYNPRLQRKYRVEDDVPVLLIAEGEPVDDATHRALLARAAAEGIGPNFTVP